MRLNQEEKDELLALFTSSGWEVLVKAMRFQEKRQLDRVMAYNLKDGPEGLVIEKARAEGAVSIIKGIIDFRNKEVRGA